MEDEVQDMILNCLAMEFLMNLDNEFEEMYFKYLPEAAIDIYDNIFVNYYENYTIINKKNKSWSFCCIKYATWLPFKLLVISLQIALPTIPLEPAIKILSFSDILSISFLLFYLNHILQEYPKLLLQGYYEEHL